MERQIIKIRLSGLKIQKIQGRSLVKDINATKGKLKHKKIKIRDIKTVEGRSY